MAHRHHHPSLSRQQHGNGGDKDVTATPMTAQWLQCDSRAVAGLAWQQRWRDIAAVAVAWLGR